jgi:hypothetical protein
LAICFRNILFDLIDDIYLHFPFESGMLNPTRAFLFFSNLGIRSTSRTGFLVRHVAAEIATFSKEIEPTLKGIEGAILSLEIQKVPHHQD